jgi:hypothetical protein
VFGLQSAGHAATQSIGPWHSGISLLHVANERAARQSSDAPGAYARCRWTPDGAASLADRCALAVVRRFVPQARKYGQARVFREARVADRKLAQPECGAARGFNLSRVRAVCAQAGSGARAIRLAVSVHLARLGCIGRCAHVALISSSPHRRHRELPAR